MQDRELIVRCCFKEDGPRVQDLLLSSFDCFLRRELQKLASDPAHHVCCP